MKSTNGRSAMSAMSAMSAISALTTVAVLALVASLSACDRAASKRGTAAPAGANATPPPSADAAAPADSASEPGDDPPSAPSSPSSTSSPPAKTSKSRANAVEKIAGGDKEKRYVIMRRSSSDISPRNGFGLLLILPGGDGSAEFRPFCRTITERSLAEGMIVVELIAPVWSSKEDRVVWPTPGSNPEKGRFTTDEFIDAVIEDLAKSVPIDRNRIIALGWSSSGPALYSELLRAKTPITGWIIAMSVFNPKSFTDDAAAVVKGRRVYLLHSPDDQLIKLQQHAAKAESRLKELGAETTLVTYPGGHGWTDDPLGRIKTAIEWVQPRNDPSRSSR